MGWGARSIPCTPADGEENKTTRPPRSSRVTQGVSKEWRPGTHPAPKQQVAVPPADASALGLPGHLARPHRPEDRLCPRCPDLLAASPQQTPGSESSEAGGSSPPLHRGDEG